MSGPLPRAKAAHLAGRWYPADPDVLARTARDLLAAGGPPRPGVVGLVVPHAPWRESGAIAGHGFAAAGPDQRRALILGPSHFASLHGAAVLPMAVYETPLGALAVDQEASAALARASFVRANPAVFMREHAIEAQLPLWQVLAPGAPFVPILVGTLAPGEAEALAALLRPLLAPGTLLVVSSDLVHYGRRFDYLPVPPTDAATVEGALRRLDDEALACIVARDADGLGRWLAASGAAVCGRHALEVLLRALPADASGTTLAHGTSLDGTDDWEPAIGYAAVAFSRPA
jgi:AmmeMemoRadiSam system protein B